MYSKTRRLQPAESQPVAQIATQSYLGAVLHNVGASWKMKRHQKSSISSGPSDTSTSDLEPSDESEDSGSKESHG